jgi:glycine oxidase ThiO
MGKGEERILIVGGGVIGCSIAYYLSLKGVKATLVERKGIGCEASSAAAGGLWPQAESSNPGPFLDLCLTGNDMFRDLSEQLKPDIEYRESGLLHIIIDEEDRKEADELVEWQERQGLEVHRLNASETLEMEPALSEDLQGSLYFPNDNHLNPLNLTSAFAEGAGKRGAEILTGVSVEGIRTIAGRVTSLVTDRGDMGADLIINAAGSWAGRIGEMVDIQVPVEPVRGQIILSEPIAPLFKTCIVTRNAYLLQKPRGNVVVGSTREFVGYDKNVTPEAIHDLHRGAVQAVPRLKDASFIRSWAGLRPYTQDEIPLLGPVDGPQGFLLATGHFRNGILLSAITGKLMAELIVEGKTSVPPERYRLERYADINQKITT